MRFNIFEFFFFVHASVNGPPVNRQSSALLCLLSLYLKPSCLFIGCVCGWSLINLPLVSSLCLLSSSSLLLPLTLCPNAPSFFPFPPLPVFLWHAVALLHPIHKVAVGDIVKVTNGQHLPADMVIVSSRLDSLYKCVCLGTFLCICAEHRCSRHYVIILCWQSTTFCYW